MAETSLETYHVDEAIISCKGPHLERGMSESNEQQAHIKNVMIHYTDVVYIMIDHTKFGVQAFSKFSDLGLIICIITDSKADAQIVKQFTDKSIKQIRT